MLYYQRNAVLLSQIRDVGERQGCSTVPLTVPFWKSRGKKVCLLMRICTEINMWDEGLDRPDLSFISQPFKTPVWWEWDFSLSVLKCVWEWNFILCVKSLGTKCHLSANRIRTLEVSSLWLVTICNLKIKWIGGNVQTLQTEKHFQIWVFGLLSVCDLSSSSRTEGNPNLYKCSNVTYEWHDI